MVKKIIKVILNILLVILGIATAGYFVYIYSINPTNKEQLLEEINPVLPELITRFDQANLDDPVVCKDELEQIGYNLTLNVADAIDFIQIIPFQYVWSASAKQLKDVKQQANKAGFDFSFAALNACEQKGFFKLDKPGLRQTLVELEESIKALN